MKEIEASPGEWIGRACERLAAEAPAFMVFNDIRVEATPGDTAAQLHGRWLAESSRRAEEARARQRSDEAASKEREEQKIRADERQRIAREILAWCDDPDVFDKVAEKSVHAVRAVAFSVRDPEWVKRLKYEVK